MLRQELFGVGIILVNKFKSFETKPRCIDLAFADRFSISLVDSNKFLVF